ncbi:ABC transporter ATP-binding protein [Desulfovibrio intestinalis]|uniref:Nickel transport system ATP-binding protein n=1 Tax=Desulfovibrio intestinalis TaxID=58621 RepID=A0A7W8C2B9_9BACT|nr:ABC transporter ATP-binding protein [Desulfovibrio intestinalis]MBB5142425.1 nickel transport system ATP-binding protein [Desulfovibrio intestinalis]
MSAVLTVKDLHVLFLHEGKSLPIVSDINFSVRRGQCLGILGESGSGKSMTCKAVLGLLDKNFEIRGSARFENRELLLESAENLRRLRGSKICTVLQNPMSCFDPLFRIGEQMEETLVEHTPLRRTALREKCLEILNLMRINNPQEVLRKYPHQLSGGMLQRVMIGLAVGLEPDLIIADEPTTAIDSISQHSIMQEFMRIKQTGKTSMIFISHDLGVLSYIADEVLVMHRGKVVEQGSPEHVFDHASDPYTRHLIAQHKAVMRKFLRAIHPAREAMA